jgi:hypothetical protein
MNMHTNRDLNILFAFANINGAGPAAPHSFRTKLIEQRSIERREASLFNRARRLWRAL